MRTKIRGSCGHGAQRAAPLHILRRRFGWVILERRVGWRCWRRGSLGDEGFVDLDHVVDHFGGGEFLFDAFAAGTADLESDFGVAEDGGEGVSERCVVVEFGEEATAAVLDDFGESASLEGDAGDFVAHCGEKGSAEAFEARGEGEEVERGIDGLHRADEAGEDDAVGGVEFCGETLEARFVGAVADEK